MKIYGWNLKNTYQELPHFFYSQVSPAISPSPQFVQFNTTLAKELGLLSDEDAIAHHLRFLSGVEPHPQSQTIAQAYAGHQFGHFTMLGDGRALLFGEQVTPAGEHLDIHLKGAGRTPFSRNGDGRAALGPMLREYLVSEAMFALGISTTRSLAVIATGRPVQREELLPGAVLVRVARSHIRVGTFEYAAHFGDESMVKRLADYTIDRHFAELRNEKKPYLALLRRVIDLQAILISKWMLVGFIHGVMNTDNMSISGETIDYGPCAFMDEFDSNATFSSIDHRGRYAFSNQIKIGAWNLERFAETLLKLIEKETHDYLEVVRGELSEFLAKARHYWVKGMREKLGLVGEDAEDMKLIQDFMALIQKNKCDFTNSFWSLEKLKIDDHVLNKDPEFAAWRERWSTRRKQGDGWKGKNINPIFIPRNHKLDQALKAAVLGDIKPFEKLLELVRNPYTDLPGAHDFKIPPHDTERIYETFCGT